MAGIEIVDIAHAIQLAVAPVFLLSGIGVILGVLTAAWRASSIGTRCGGRGRAPTPRTTRPRHERSCVCSRGARVYINVAITLITITALLVALVVALLFASTFVPMNLATPRGGAVRRCRWSSLVVALVAFLLEVRIAIAALRIGSW